MIVTLLTENKFHAAEIVKETIQQQIETQISFGAEYGMNTALVLTCSNEVQVQRIVRYAENTACWYAGCHLKVRRS